MTDRFDKALADLQAWRVCRDAFLETRAPSAAVASVVRSIDSALKSEVLEWRIRRAVAAQVGAGDEEVGRQLGDLDWWLTESTMRSLHAGLDGLAQLLNVAFHLNVNPDDSNLPQEVAKHLARRHDLAAVTAAIGHLWASDACRNLRAFVNHVKHAGFPGRGIRGDYPSDGFPRFTSIERFAFESTPYGPWSPADIDQIIDGFRAEVLRVMKALTGECHA